MKQSHFRSIKLHLYSLYCITFFTEFISFLTALRIVLTGQGLSLTFWLNCLAREKDAPISNSITQIAFNFITVLEKRIRQTRLVVSAIPIQFFLTQKTFLMNLYDIY